MNDLDYTFGWEGVGGAGGKWDDMHVVHFQGSEEISGLYRYDITLAVKAPATEVDPQDLVHARASLRIKTLTQPAFKVVHGVISSAEELHSIPGGMLYRVILEPPLVRAKHRRRCRIFLEKTIRHIIDAVLQGDPLLQLAAGATVDPDDGTGGKFTPAKERFSWRVTDTSRLDSVAARSFCVQYNESDLAFVARLLEEEGISYHFENGDGVCLLVLSDADAGRSKVAPFEPLGINVDAREVTSIRLGARLRPSAVTFADYNWKKPTLDMTANEPAASKGKKADLFDFEYPGGYPDTPAQGKPLAKAVLERYEIEGQFAVCKAKARLLSAGSIFFLEHSKSRYEGEYLVTRLDVVGDQKGALPGNQSADPDVFEAHVECARRGKAGKPEESRFRPARITPRPRIVGSQTAFVTAEPNAQGAEINVGGPPGGDIGCVRLRFHWDHEEPRLAKEPSSCWVRVSQVFAGAGQGGVWHPRVGVEAIVEFEEGDPDRPLVTGRVYNGANRPPAGPPTYSTLKSFTSPGNGKYNEFAFEDAAGNEAITLHASRDWNSQVGRNRSENVGLNSASSVAVDRTESTGSNRTASVGTNNTECVGSNEMITVGSNQTLSVGANQTQTVGANSTSIVGANQSVSVGANASMSVSGDHSVSVDGSETVSVSGSQSITVSGAQSTTVTGLESFTASGPQTIHSDASQTVTAPAQTFIADGLQDLESATQTVKTATHTLAASGSSTTDTPAFTVNSTTLILNGDGSITIKGGPITITGGTIGITGSAVSVDASSVAVNGGGLINMSAGLIKMN